MTVEVIAPTVPEVVEYATTETVMDLELAVDTVTNAQTELLIVHESGTPEVIEV